MHCFFILVRLSNLQGKHLGIKLPRLKNLLSSFGCPCGMDSDNDDFIQEHFPDADKENMFRATDEQQRIVGLYHK